MNWTYSPIFLFHAIKDSEKRKLMLMSVLAKELVKLNDKSFYIIL